MCDGMMYWPKGKWCSTIEPKNINNILKEGNDARPIISSLRYAPLFGWISLLALITPLRSISSYTFIPFPRFARSLRSSLLSVVHSLHSFR